MVKLYIYSESPDFVAFRLVFPLVVTIFLAGCVQTAEPQPPALIEGPEAQTYLSGAGEDVDGWRATTWLGEIDGATSLWWNGTLEFDGEDEPTVRLHWDIWDLSAPAKAHTVRVFGITASSSNHLAHAGAETPIGYTYQGAGSDRVEFFLSGSSREVRWAAAPLEPVELNGTYLIVMKVDPEPVEADWEAAIRTTGSITPIQDWEWTDACGDRQNHDWEHGAGAELFPVSADLERRASWHSSTNATVFWQNMDGLVADATWSLPDGREFGLTDLTGGGSESPLEKGAVLVRPGPGDHVYEQSRGVRIGPHAHIGWCSLELPAEYFA